MADSIRRDLPNLSVIPYDNNREVILRNEDVIVYRDQQTRQLVAAPRSRDVDERLRRGRECPTCHRPWHSPRAAPMPDIAIDSSVSEEPSFISQNYFQALAHSLSDSGDAHPPASPRRRLAQPVRSRLSSPISPTPPPNAEFIGSSPAPPSAGNTISESAFSPGYFEKFFTIEKELGRGGRGVVLLVHHVLDGVPLGHFACKRLPIGDDHAWLEKVLVEVQVLTSLSHQNLVSYRHVWLEDFQINAFSPRVPCAFILQQYCNGGDLHNFICSSAHSTTTTQQLKERIRRRSRGETELPRKVNEPKKLHFEQIYAFFSDITAGLRFLHLNGFIHRDLKPSNCLLHTVNNETRVLVSDFGEVQYENAARKSTGATGTISYCAPEVLQRVSPDGPFGNFTFKSDIFSLGMILHFLCFANLPYLSANVLFEEREDVDRLRHEIIEWSGFDDHQRVRPELPQELYTFLKRLLSLDPDSRPSADDVNQGIMTGRLSDTLPQFRRRSSVTAEELTPGRRVQKLDTPTQGNSPTRGAGLGLDVGATRHKPQPLNVRRRSRSRERSRLATNASAVEDDEDDQTANEEDDDHGNGKEFPARLSASVILRPKVPFSPSRANSTYPDPSLERRPQLLLPPPTDRSLRVTVFHVLQTRITPMPIRGLILAVKLLSALQPCVAQGLNATVVYPLLTMAAIEMTLMPYRVWESITLALVHIVVLIVAMQYNLLCSVNYGRRNFMAWDDDH